MWCGEYSQRNSDLRTRRLDRACRSTAIFGGNNARLYNVNPQRAADALARDRFAELKLAYDAAGPSRSNLRYGYVTGPIDPSVFA